MNRVRCPECGNDVWVDDARELAVSIPLWRFVLTAIAPGGLVAVAALAMLIAILKGTSAVVYTIVGGLGSCGCFTPLLSVPFAIYHGVILMALARRPVIGRHRVNSTTLILIAIVGMGLWLTAGFLIFAAVVTMYGP